MANTYKAFKGILQYKSTDTFTKQAGYIYFVREFKDGNATGNAEVWFGTRKYGDINTTGIAELQRQITANAGDITSIKNILGEWSAKFQGDISTVANAVVAVSGATTTNTSAIATLNGDAQTAGSVAKAVADAKSELVNGASDGYNTLKGLETEIKAVAQSVTDKNVSAEGDGTYITASAKDNKVTVTATKKTTDAIALAETALQKNDIAEGTTNGTIKVGDTNVAVHGLGSAAYTEASAYDVSGAAATVKSDLLGTTKDGDATTIAALNTKIDDVEAAAKSYTISAVTVSDKENVLEAYALYDEDGTQAGETIKIYKDQSLKNVELSGQTLVFTYELAAGSEKTVSVDVSAFLSESEFGNGLQVVDHKVSVKKDASSEGFLSVSADGIKLSGVQDAIDDAVANKNVEATGDTYVSATVSGNKVTVGATTELTNAINNANSAVQTIATGSANGTINVDGEDVAVKGLGSVAYTEASAYATAAQGTKADNAATNADFEAHSGNTVMHITADERSAWNAKLDTTTHTAYTAATKTTLDSIETRLTAITNNAVTSVASSGNTIATTNTNGAVNVDVNTLAVETAQANGYIAIENNGGALYGVMYYGGDDAE